ncbi:hypothetical protein [Pseudobythopirellula maris]|nr:hypothetical protein [Pseudobythopirellula maris]
MIDTPRTVRLQSPSILTALAFTLLLAAPALGAKYPAYVDGSFTFGDEFAEAPYGLESTFSLSSNPNATKTIYLDFTGFHSVGNSWGHNIVFPAYDLDGDSGSFSDEELIEIQQIFQNVAEDYIPFNVNVTTADPGATALRKLGDGDTHWGMRVVMTQATAGFGVGIGGDSGSSRFDDAADNPVFTFNKGARKGGLTASHEVGHTFGLAHDSYYDQEYHPGTGGYGRTSWGPLMGAPFDASITQWSNGDYAGSSNTFDDYSFITSKGFGFREDDYLNSLADPHLLESIDGEISEWGIIEERYDRDYFRFTTTTGEVSFDVNGFAQDPNIDVGVVIYDSLGEVVVELDPSVTPNINYDLFLTAGDYTFFVDGVDNPGRYSDYGSLGFYDIQIGLPIAGDLNSDGFVDTDDWLLLVAGAETDLSGLSAEEAFLAGDLNGDGLNDIYDFGLFKDAFTSAHGAAEFAALLAPEPAGLGLATAMVLMLAGYVRCGVRTN